MLDIVYSVSVGIFHRYHVGSRRDVTNECFRVKDKVALECVRRRRAADYPDKSRHHGQYDAPDLVAVEQFHQAVDMVFVVMGDKQVVNGSRIIQQGAVYGRVNVGLAGASAVIDTSRSAGQFHNKQAIAYCKEFSLSHITKFVYKGLFIGQRLKRVELVAKCAPGGKAAGHQRFERGTMVRHRQTGQLVDYDKFDALQGDAGKLQAENE